MTLPASRSLNSSDNEAREVGLVLGERCRTCKNFRADDCDAATCQVWPDLPPVFRLDGCQYTTRLSYSLLSHLVVYHTGVTDYLDFARQAAYHPTCALYERGPTS